MQLLLFLLIDVVVIVAAEIDRAAVDVVLFCSEPLAQGALEDVADELRHQLSSKGAEVQELKGRVSAMRSELDRLDCVCSVVRAVSCWRHACRHVTSSAQQQLTPKALHLVVIGSSRSPLGGR